MKQLWSKTLVLLRRSPSLWLPVILAAFLNYCLDNLRVIADRRIVATLFQKQSVLAGSVGQPDTAKIYALTGSLGIALELAGVCCFVVAMLTIARMTGRRIAQDEQPVPYADLAIRNHIGSVLSIGFLALILAGACVALTFLATSSYAMSAHRSSLLTRPYILAGQLLPMYFVLAYFLTPLGLKLLSRSLGGTIMPTQLSLARKFSLLAGTAISVLAFLQLSIAKDTLMAGTSKAAFAMIGTVIVALPYTPLFVALSLLAIESSDTFILVEGKDGTDVTGLSGEAVEN